MAFWPVDGGARCRDQGRGLAGPPVKGLSDVQKKLITIRLYSLPRLCLEGFLLFSLKGPGSGKRPGRFPQSSGS
eukprot:5141006-Pyramimonas_sp.AAC.1